MHSREYWLTIGRHIYGPFANREGAEDLKRFFETMHLHGKITITPAKRRK